MDNYIPTPLCDNCELPIAEDDDNSGLDEVCECYYCDVCGFHYTREDPCLYH